jgi:hypothetical protein
MARFDAVRPEQINPVLLLDEFATGPRHGFRKDQLLKPTLRIDLVEEICGLSIATRHWLPG